MTDTATSDPKPAATLGHKLKLAAVIASLIVVAIVVIQNTEQVQTRILFMTITMPRAVLLSYHGCSRLRCGPADRYSTDFPWPRGPI